MKITFLLIYLISSQSNRKRPCLVILHLPFHRPSLGVRSRPLRHNEDQQPNPPLFVYKIYFLILIRMQGDTGVRKTNTLFIVRFTFLSCKHENICKFCFNHSPNLSPTFVSIQATQFCTDKFNNLNHCSTVNLNLAF